MSEQDIQEFSIEGVNQEEKDFLVYMYGDDLEKVSNKKPFQVKWWIEAFQAVKEDNRPKFNWSAFFLSTYWCLRKKNFTFALALLILNIPFCIFANYLFVEFTVDQILNNNKLLNPLYWGIFAHSIIAMLLSGFVGPYILIKKYKTQYANMTVRNGRLPFFLIFCDIIITSIMNLVLGEEKYYANLNTYGPLFFQFFYIIALMKFWLPVKKTI